MFSWSVTQFPVGALSDCNAQSPYSQGITLNLEIPMGIKRTVGKAYQKLLFSCRREAAHNNYGLKPPMEIAI